MTGRGLHGGDEIGLRIDALRGDGGEADRLVQRRDVVGTQRDVRHLSEVAVLRDAGVIRVGDDLVRSDLVRERDEDGVDRLREGLGQGALWARPLVAGVVDRRAVDVDA